MKNRSVLCLILTLLFTCRKSASLALTGNDYVEVTIKGLTCFYVEKDGQGKYINPMLLIIKDSTGSHTPRLTLPATDSAQLYNAIGQTDCTKAACAMGNYRIRITDGGAALTKAFKPTNAFRDDVVHLTESNPGFTDFTDDAKDTTEPPKGGILAVLELTGAEVQQVIPFPAPAKFNPDACSAAAGSFHRFAQLVKLRFPAANPGLQFVVASNDARDVAFTGSNPQKGMRMTNLSSMAGSHMTMLRQLSKSGACLRDPIPGPVSGPNPTPDYVPGCGNTQWP